MKTTGGDLVIQQHLNNLFFAVDDIHIMHLKVALFIY